LIDDLLDLTRIARGKFNLLEEVFFVEGIIETAVNTCRPDLEGRELEVVRDLRAPSAAVLGDSARLTQVLWNILKNAIKFTADGGTITIRSRVRRGEEASQVVIEIEDTGVGIEPDLLPRIFSAFEQGGGETTRRFGGLGLGLTISQAIVRAHHGSLSASSPGHGRGSTFTVTLPVVRKAESPARDPSSEPAKTISGHRRPAAGRSLRILLVEDHHDTGMVLKRVVGSWGHTVWHAGSVAEALRVVDAEIDAHAPKFDLVISDLGLPDGSGLNLMRALSEKYAVPGIALSGYGMETDIKASTEAGFRLHLTKPVDTNRLRAAVQEVAEEKSFS